MKRSALYRNGLSQWYQAKAQLQVNSRLQWGGWLIILIMLLWLNLLLGDYRQILADEFEQLNWQQQDQQSLLRGDDWLGHLQQARRSLDILNERFGSTSNEALARAEVQNRVNIELERLGVEQPRVEISRAPESQSLTQLVPLQLSASGRTRGDRLLELLSVLERGAPLLRVTSLSTNVVPGDQVQFTLLATVWYRPFGAKQ